MTVTEQTALVPRAQVEYHLEGVQVERPAAAPRPIKGGLFPDGLPWIGFGVAGFVLLLGTGWGMFLYLNLPL